MHKKILFLLTAVSVFTSGAVFAQEAECEDTVTVGAWNIQHLGSPGSRPNVAKGVAQAPAELAAYIIASEVDILALVEIGDDDNREGRTNSTLDRVMTELGNATGATWSYLLFANRQEGDTTQLTGVLWNQRKVGLVGEPYRVPIQRRGSEWDRHPHAVKFSCGAGKTDLVVIPVHMKSNVGGRETTSAQRALEAKGLMDQLAKIKSELDDSDIVILGDLNVLSGDEAAVSNITRRSFYDLNENNVPTTYKGAAPFDRIFVPKRQSEFDESLMYVLESGHEPKDHFVKLSDHYMVTTTVCLMDDDDN
jgi:hypothetical protein